VNLEVQPEETGCSQRAKRRVYDHKYQDFLATHKISWGKWRPTIRSTANCQTENSW
jgi:hypothetical protein